MHQRRQKSLIQYGKFYAANLKFVINHLFAKSTLYLTIIHKSHRQIVIKRGISQFFTQEPFSNSSRQFYRQHCTRLNVNS